MLLLDDVRMNNERLFYDCRLLTTVLSFGIDSWPILKFIGVEFAIEIRCTLLQPCLRITYGLVVNKRANFLQKEIEQQASRQVADRLGHVRFKITLYRSDRICTRLF